MLERLQKILSRSGYGSRRACEELIQDGRVQVNGRLAHVGDKADTGSDVVTVDGKRIPPATALVYIALYKPRNVISSVDDPAGRKTVIDLVPEAGGLYPVGRLDWDSEGLVLLTNDGELTNRLTHPRYGHTKEYRVLVARRPDEVQLGTWRSGIVLEDGHRTAAANVQVEQAAGKGAWLRITMGEGRKRQIRETGALVGLPVVRIIRTRISSLLLGSLHPGQWRRLTDVEIQSLRQGTAGSSGHSANRSRTTRAGHMKRQRTR
jgi:23S rRNA pseudouridine2605 synthase